MRFIIKIMLIAALAYFTGLFMPWWGIVVAGAVVSFLIPTSSFSAFVSGFIGVGLLWLVLSWQIEIESKGILTEKVARIFTLDDPILLVLAAGIIGALCGGFGSLTGNSFRQIFLKKNSKGFYG